MTIYFYTIFLIPSEFRILIPVGNETALIYTPVSFFGSTKIFSSEQAYFDGESLSGCRLKESVPRAEPRGRIHCLPIHPFHETAIKTIKNTSFSLRLPPIHPLSLLFPLLISCCFISSIYFRRGKPSRGVCEVATLKIFQKSLLSPTFFLPVFHVVVLRRKCTKSIKCLRQRGDKKKSCSSCCSALSLLSLW